jgi:hypothetical protein
LALWAPRLTGPIDLRYDAGVHYVLGTALAEGHGYRLLSEPGAIEAIQYPPLLAMIVAAHQWLVGTADPAIAGHALRLTWAALFVVYALAVFALARRWLSRGWAFVATMLVLLNLQLLWLSDALFAELPFACATVLFLLAADDDRRGLAGLLGAAGYLLRASGLALLVAWIVDALLQRRLLEAALRAAIAALPILVWHAYVAEVQSRAAFTTPAYAYQRAPYNFYNVTYAANLAYVDPFVPERGAATPADLVRRVATNVLALPESLGESVSVRAEGPLRPVFQLRDQDRPSSPTLRASRVGFALIGIVAALGLAMLAADGIRLAPLAWLASLALAVLTPWPSQFARYLVPLAPLTAIGLVLVLANGARVAHPLVQAAVGAAVGVLIAAELLVLAAVFGSRHEWAVPSADAVAAGRALPAQRLFFYPPRWQLHDDALDWLGTHAPRDAIVATSTPQRLYLRTGLHAVFPPFEPNPDAAERLLRNVPVEYVVVDELDFLDVTRRYAEPALAAHPERWRLVYAVRDSGTAEARGPTIYRRIAR